jgi:hypothetical protein
MGKSGSRKKQDRAKAASRRAEQERRRVKAARQRQSAERFEQLNDPSISPVDVAKIIAAEFPDQAIAADMMRMRMAFGVPAEEVSETAKLLLERAEPEPPGIGALAIAALAAHLAGDEVAERRYARELLAGADASRDPGQWLDVIGTPAGRDHPGETCQLIGPYLREHPDDERAADIYVRALEKAHAQAEPGEPEKAALGRYRDRSDVEALDRAVDEFMARTQWGEAVREWVNDQLAGQKSKRWKDSERDATAALLAEAAIHFPIASETGGAEDDDTPDTPIRAFAAAAEAPAELAARAIERDEYLRYGIWQVAGPSPSPGIWCTDLITGTRRYAQFPAEVIDSLPPWSVWLGGLGPVEGIWRATRAGIWLSPIEGDAVAEYAEDAVWRMLHSITGEPADYPPPPEQVRFGQAEPYCVRWEAGEEAEPELGHFVSPAIARLAPQLAGWVWMKRAKGVVLTNTDGELMELIDATVTVDGDVTERLTARSDFGEEEGGEDGEIVWWGKEVDNPYEEERVLLGRLTPQPGRIRAKVNSRRRLKRLLLILKEICAAPKATEESRSWPSVDFAWAPVPADGVTARQWAEDWIDQTVAVLDFRTPRQAAEGDYAERLRLEGLLRQLEYQSALPAERGGRPVDTAWLRAELDYAPVSCGKMGPGQPNSVSRNGLLNTPFGS